MTEVIDDLLFVVPLLNCQVVEVCVNDGVTEDRGAVDVNGLRKDVIEFSVILALDSSDHWA